MYKIILFPFYLLSLLPIKVLYFLSDCTAFLLRKVFHYRKSVIYTNLSRSFPKLRYRDLDRIATRFYRYFTDVFFESIWSISATSKDIRKKITIENPEVLNEMYSRYKKAIIVMGHTGNWELMGSALCQPIEGKSTTYRKANYMILYKKMKNGWMNHIMEKYRSRNYKRMGNNGRIIDSHSIVDYIASHEDESNFYFFIADQSGKSNARFITNFLNQRTLVLPGPETIARGFNMPVVYLRMNRYKRDKYKISFTTICEEGKRTKRGEITATYMSLLEQDIQKNKACWLWSHKRWKANPSKVIVRLYDISQASTI